MARFTSTFLIITLPLLLVILHSSFIDARNIPNIEFQGQEMHSLWGSNTITKGVVRSQHSGDTSTLHNPMVFHSSRNLPVRLLADEQHHLEQSAPSPLGLLTDEQHHLEQSGPSPRGQGHVLAR